MAPNPEGEDGVEMADVQIETQDITIDNNNNNNNTDLNNNIIQQERVVDKPSNDDNEGGGKVDVDKGVAEFNALAEELSVGMFTAFHCSCTLSCAHARTLTPPPDMERA